MRVDGSSSRKLGQPLVRQKGRPSAVWAAVARRRNRRMELARPAYVAVALRDIMSVVLRFFLARIRRCEPGQRPCVCSARTPVLGRERCGGPGGVPGASVVRGARPGPSLRTGDLSIIAENADWRCRTFGRDLWLADRRTHRTNRPVRSDPAMNERGRLTGSTGSVGTGLRPRSFVGDPDLGVRMFLSGQGWRWPRSSVVVCSLRANGHLR
jgi:hypothetical protein